MFQSKKTKKIFILVIIIFICLLAVNIFWSIQIRNQVNEIIFLKKSVQQENDKNQNLSGIKKEIEELKQANSILKGVFIERSGVVFLIENLEEIFDKSGVDAQIMIHDIESTEPFSDLQIYLSTTGSWKNVITFLQMIQDLPFEKRLDGLKMTVTQAGDSGGWKLDVTLSLIVI